MFQIKICGITSADDAIDAAEAGADAIGLNFYPPSPRAIDVELAADIIQAIPSGVMTVGVFVNSDVEDVVAVAGQLALDFVQLHGDEPPDQIAALKPWRVIRAFRCDGHVEAQIEMFLKACQRTECPPAGLLIDASHRGAYGGTGKTANWDQVRQLGSIAGGLPIVLAGGLTPDNVAEAIATCRPAGVDTASGVESSPGKKSHRLMSDFVSRAKCALRENRDD